MKKLKEQFNHFRHSAVQHLHALRAKPQAPAKPQPEDPPARDLLTRGAGKVHKIGKPFHWN